MFVKPFTLILLLSLPVFQPTGDIFTSHDKHGTKQKKNEPAYTKAQQEKLRQAEKAADHFVKRWRETLDLNILFDELYVTDPGRRQRNLLLFCDVYVFMNPERGCRELIGKVDNETLKRGFFGFWNLVYMQADYDLAFSKPEDYDSPTPPGFEALEEEFEAVEKKYGESGPRSGQIRQFVLDITSTYEKMNALYRRYISPEMFISTRYKENYQREYAKYDDSEILTEGLNKFSAKPGEIIYRVKRGEFYLFFVEEAGHFKVLTIGYEL